MSPVTAVKVKLAMYIASRHKRLSVAIRPVRMAKASHTLATTTLAPASVSTSILTPYCAPIEDTTAPSTAAKNEAVSHRAPLDIAGQESSRATC